MTFTSKRLMEIREYGWFIAWLNKTIMECNESRSGLIRRNMQEDWLDAK